MSDWAIGFLCGPAAAGRWEMTDTELKMMRGHIADARRSGNPAIQSLAAVCEHLIIEILELREREAQKGKD